MLKACDFPKFETHHYFAKARFFHFIIYVDFQLQKQAIIFLVIPISCVLWKSVYWFWPPIVF